MGVSITNARNTLGRLITASHSKDKAVFVTKRGTPVAVLMSCIVYESLRETAIVTSDGPLVRGMRKGLRELKAKKARAYTLDELFS